ncbi:MAG: DegT/DnrJ/EryC1/StrS family aminotransferase [Pyrinomonadaceae bacterium]
MRSIANHGQAERYYHERVSVNSRLDSIQAVILDIKLRHLDEYCDARRRAADAYDAAFEDVARSLQRLCVPHSTYVSTNTRYASWTADATSFANTSPRAACPPADLLSRAAAAIERLQGFCPRQPRCPSPTACAPR